MLSLPIPGTRPDGRRGKEVKPMAQTIVAFALLLALLLVIDRLTR